MTLEESRKLADKMFDELESALVPKGWVPGERGLYHRCNRELFLLTSDGRALAVVKVRTNAGYGDGSGVPSIMVNELSANSYWVGVSVEEALPKALSLTVAITGRADS